MKSTAPHFLLFTQANDPPRAQKTGGSWKFVLEEIGSEFRIEEGDLEPGIYGERLQLLAVVRGLERLEQPSLVTLVTPSKYVGRGIRSGLRQWKANQWQWEHYGEKQTIKHASLWKRIDAALQFHRVSCRIWQFDVPHSRVQAPVASECETSREPSPFVSQFADESGDQHRTEPFYNRTKIRASRKIRIDAASRNRFAEKSESLPQAESNVPERSIKPIGKGKAFGYAMV